MIEHPDSLTDRPDLLSDALRTIRLTGAVYYRVDTTSPWPAIKVPSGETLAPAFDRRTRTVASYHVVVNGSCWAAAGDLTPVQVHEGDVVVFPTGHPYVLSCELPAGEPADGAPALVDLLKGVSSNTLPPNFTFGEGEDRTAFVCGFLGCDPLPFSPLFQGLPSMLVVRSITDRLATLVELALAEAHHAGSVSVRERLTESMFIETLRAHLTGAPDQTWLTETQDGVVARAIALLRDDPARAWSLNELASEVGVSRSVLASRFATNVGQPPMQYLARCRLELAARLLDGGDTTVAGVARRVGYGSEAAFSRAFKRSTGVTPRDWRRHYTG